jgi:hypothetical protein
MESRVVLEYINLIIILSIRENIKRDRDVEKGLFTIKQTKLFSGVSY